MRLTRCDSCKREYNPNVTAGAWSVERASDVASLCVASHYDVCSDACLSRVRASTNEKR